MTDAERKMIERVCIENRLMYVFMGDRVIPVAADESAVAACAEVMRLTRERCAEIAHEQHALFHCPCIEIKRADLGEKP